MTKPFSLWEAATNGSSDDGDDGDAVDEGVVGAALVVPPWLEQAAKATAAAATRGRAVQRIFPTFAEAPFGPWVTCYLL
jgi:hypothetical protein